MDPIIYESRCKIQQALREVQNIESITKNPASYINQHFDKNKQLIQWRRVNLIADINKYSDQLIEENESNQLKCLQISAQTKEWARIIDSLKDELNKLRDQFDTFDSRVTKLSCEITMNTANYLKDRLSQSFKDYQESLLLNENLSFVFFDQRIEDIVGKVIDKNQVKLILIFYINFIKTNLN
jgi:hypothetical protein